MTITLRRPRGVARRPLAGLTATAVAAAALASLPTAPAHAEDEVVVPAPAASVLSWEISEQFDAHLSTHTYTGGVTETDGGVLSFPGGTVDQTAPAGVARIDYTGSVTGAFLNPAPPNAQLYAVSVADPTVEVNLATGVGTISADVGYVVGAGATANVTRVDMVTFTATSDEWVTTGGVRTLTQVTPDYAGVLQPNTPESAAAGLAADRPYDAKSFSPELLTLLPSSLKAHFFQSTAAAQPNKVPANFDAGFAATAASLATTATGVDVTVHGANFAQRDFGVYASIRESAAGAPAYAGGSVVPDLGTVWVSDNAADIGGGDQGAATSIAADGSFSATIALPLAVLEDLDPAKVYSVVTRKAHGGGTAPAYADRVTETVLDTAALIALRDSKTVPAISLSAPGVAYGTDASVTVGVSTGGGTVTLTGAGDPQTVAVDNDDHQAVFTVPAGLAVGSHELTATTTGDAATWGGSTTGTLTVAKASSPVTLSVPKGTYGASVTVKATVPGASGASGTVQLSGVGAQREATLVNGTATFVLPAATPAKSYPLTAAYVGDANHEAGSTTGTLVVARTTSRFTLVKVTKVPTRRAAGRASVRLATGTGVKVTGRATLTLTRGKVVKRIAVNLRNGAAVVTLPKLAKGTWRATASWAGTTNVSRPANRVATFSVRR